MQTGDITIILFGRSPAGTWPTKICSVQDVWRIAKMLADKQPYEMARPVEQCCGGMIIALAIYNVPPEKVVMGGAYDHSTYQVYAAVSADDDRIITFMETAAGCFYGDITLFKYLQAIITA